MGGDRAERPSGAVEGEQYDGGDGERGEAASWFTA